MVLLTMVGEIEPLTIIPFIDEVIELPFITTEEPALVQTAQEAKLIWDDSMSTVPEEVIPTQSPATAEPVPVDPPTLLSFIEVKMMGCWAVPMAFRVPSTPI